MNFFEVIVYSLRCLCKLIKYKISNKLVYYRKYININTDTYYIIIKSKYNFLNIPKVKSSKI